MMSAPEWKWRFSCLEPTETCDKNTGAETAALEAWFSAVLCKSIFYTGWIKMLLISAKAQGELSTADSMFLPLGWQIRVS